MTHPPLNSSLFGGLTATVPLAPVGEPVIKGGKKSRRNRKSSKGGKRSKKSRRTRRRR
jgi:hypothetical protein